MPIDLPNGNEEIQEDLSQKEIIPNTLPENGKTIEVIKKTQEMSNHSAKVKIIPNPVDVLLDKNLDAKKKMADELCEMGLSVEEILRILRF